MHIPHENIHLCTFRRWRWTTQWKHLPRLHFVNDLRPQFSELYISNSLLFAFAHFLGVVFQWIILTSHRTCNERWLRSKICLFWNQQNRNKAKYSLNSFSWMNAKRQSVSIYFRPKGFSISRSALRISDFPLHSFTLYLVPLTSFLVLLVLSVRRRFAACVSLFHRLLHLPNNCYASSNPIRMTYFDYSSAAHSHTHDTRSRWVLRT